MKSRRKRWAVHVTCKEEEEYIRKFSRKKHFERPRRRWEDSVKMNLE
jgi:hypothetical protein